mmetsp:Transcript_34642/g.97179  ORF Transcript_34642/g.97179 Transcript_34642/m.97179 type:complete len:98 (-) Transcript_34642:88-381(-)
MGVVRMALVLAFCAFATATRPSEGVELETRQQEKYCCCKTTVTQQGTTEKTYEWSTETIKCNACETEWKQKCEALKPRSNYHVECRVKNGAKKAACP